MFKVLVVDDEKFAREKMKYLIDWEETEFEIVDYAKNGKEALAKYHELKPDLIITDILMPIMDGIELISKIREQDGKQKFIILSCHEDFRYAKQAIKMGVVDYLVKDIVNAEELYSVLKKVTLELAKDPEPRLIKESLDINNQTNLQHKTAILKRLIFERVNKEEYEKIIKEQDFAIDVNQFSVMLLRINEEPYVGNDNELRIVIKSILDQFYGGECIYNEKREFIILFNLPYTHSGYVYISESYEIANHIKSFLLRDKNYRALISIYHMKVTMENLSKVYQELVESIKHSLFIGVGEVVFTNTALPKVNPNAPKLLKEALEKLNLYLQDYKEEKVIETLKAIYEDRAAGFMEYNYVKHVNSQILNVLIENIKKCEIQYRDVFDVDYIPIDQLMQLDTVKEMIEWFCRIFSRVIRKCKEKQTMSYGKRVNDAIKYINQYYFESINLSSISECIGVHKVYLCRLFKEETGYNLTDYVTKTRIEKAIEMMQQTQLKLYEIGEKVGFTDARQFSTSFKKVVGISPTEYRDQIN